MKKTLMIMLALVMVLALTVGCGKNAEPPVSEPAVADEAIAREGADMAEGWPIADLPDGFPAYPNGKVIDIDGEYDSEGILIEISGTDESTYDAYLTTLEKDGWQLSLVKDMDLIYLLKGNMALFTGFGEPGGFVMYLIDYGYEYDVQEWPFEALPQGFPVYPDGIVTYVNIYADNEEAVDDEDEIDEEDLIDEDIDDEFSNDEDFVYITIDQTSEETFEAYLETLEEMGWTELSREGFIVQMEKDEYWLNIEFFSDYDQVGLGVMVMDLWGDNEWPVGLPYDLPEYTDGTLVRVSMHDDGGMMIMIDGTSDAVFDKYTEDMVKAGWIITDSVDREGRRSYLMDYKDSKWFCNIVIEDSSDVTIVVMPMPEDE